MGGRLSVSLGLAIGYFPLDVRCSMLDVGCSVRFPVPVSLGLAIGYFPLDVRCSMLDVGCWMFSSLPGAIYTSLQPGGLLPLPLLIFPHIFLAGHRGTSHNSQRTAKSRRFRLPSDLESAGECHCHSRQISCRKPSCFWPSLHARCSAKKMSVTIISTGAWVSGAAGLTMQVVLMVFLGSL